MSLTLADFLNEPETVQSEAIQQCLTCPECLTELSQAIARHGSKKPEYLYAYCCERHAPYLRAILNPAYILFLNKEIERLGNVCDTILKYIETTDRIEKGTLLLTDESLSPEKRHAYQMRLRDLQKKRDTSPAHRYRDIHAVLLHASGLCEDYEEIVRLALAFDEPCIV